MAAEVVLIRLGQRGRHGSDACSALLSLAPLSAGLVAVIAAIPEKNYLFAGSDAGAERAAILYSLLRTAALAGIDTYAYLIKLLERLAAGWPQRRIDELLPEHHVPAVEPAEAAVAVPQPVG